MQVSLAVNQFTTVTLEGLQPFQADGRFDTPPKWTCQNCTIARIEPAKDGCSCKVIGLKKGTTTLTVSDENNATTPRLSFEIAVSALPTATFGATIEPPTSLEDEGSEPLNPFLGPRIDGNAPVVNQGATSIAPDDARFAEHVE